MPLYSFIFFVNEVVCSILKKCLFPLAVVTEKGMNA